MHRQNVTVTEVKTGFIEEDGQGEISGPRGEIVLGSLLRTLISINELPVSEPSNPSIITAGNAPLDWIQNHLKQRYSSI